MDDNMLNNALLTIADQSKVNNAWSARQASDLRSWQTAQNLYTNTFNAREAATNRNWQEYMSNTSHQREVRDMMAAGLNPILSAGGQGASVTSGATASGVTSSGAMGNTDESANMAFASILGTLLQTDANLRIADMSAKTNLAVADKYNAASELVAQIQGLTSTTVADINRRSAANVAGINAASAKELERMREAHTEYMAQAYPSNTIQALNDIFGKLFGDGGSGVGAIPSFGDILGFGKSGYDSLSDWFKSLFGLSDGHSGHASKF